MLGILTKQIKLPNFKMECWTRGRTVGRGSTATVSIATDHRSGDVFAVKSAQLSQSEFLKREQKILTTLKCPQIVAYKGCDITSENGQFVYNLFMEYASGGNLSDAIQERGGRLDEPTIRFLSREILVGLEYLHSNGVVHCDIKGPNILLASDNGVKIADLGCAKLVSDLAPTSIAGTPVYMAPEVARGEQQGFPADIWALGCTVIEMATGRAPWVDVSDPVSAVYRIGFSNDVPEIPTFTSKQGKDFLSKCLMRDPEKRWSAGELLKHEFLEEPKIILKEINSFNSDTPNSVLDQSIWESMEELGTIQNPTQKSSLNSPVERIRQLGAGTVPNWTWDENWVTVRSNGIEEPEFSCTEDTNLTSADEPTTSRGTYTVWGNQEYSLQCSTEPKSPGGINTFNTRSSGSVSSRSSHKEKGSSMACKCRREVMSGNINFYKRHENVVCCIVKSLLYCNSIDPALLLLLQPKLS